MQTNSLINQPTNKSDITPPCIIQIVSYNNTDRTKFDDQTETPDCFISFKLPENVKTIYNKKNMKIEPSELKGKPCIKQGEPEGGFQLVRTHLVEFAVETTFTIKHGIPKFTMIEMYLPVEFVINK